MPVPGYADSKCLDLRPGAPIVHREYNPALWRVGTQEEISAWFRETLPATPRKYLSYRAPGGITMSDYTGPWTLNHATRTWTNRDGKVVNCEDVC